MQENEDRIIKISGLEPEDFKSYRVDIELDESEYLNPDINQKAISSSNKVRHHFWLKI